VSSGGPSKPTVDTSANTYVLFLDMQEVEDLVLCKQVVNQARKHSHNPVLGPGDVHDWDGVVWHKPMLGLYEFNGRQDNSICLALQTRWQTTLVLSKIRAKTTRSGDTKRWRK
jgi:hypothetical protein